jgi:hypothetical protein
LSGEGLQNTFFSYLILDRKLSGANGIFICTCVLWNRSLIFHDVSLLIGWMKEQVRKIILLGKSSEIEAE